MGLMITEQNLDSTEIIVKVLKNIIGRRGGKQNVESTHAMIS